MGSESGSIQNNGCAQRFTQTNYKQQHAPSIDVDHASFMFHAPMHELDGFHSFNTVTVFIRKIDMQIKQIYIWVILYMGYIIGYIYGDTCLPCMSDNFVHFCYTYTCG